MLTLNPWEMKRLLLLVLFSLRFDEINIFFAVFYLLDSVLNSLYLILKTLESFV